MNIMKLLKIFSSYIKPVLLITGGVLMEISAIGLIGWLFGIGFLGIEMIVLAFMINYSDNHK